MIKLKSLLTEVEHGFDLTDFKHNKYPVVLKNLGIKPKANQGRDGWEWKGNGIMIVTANNPITGEYATRAGGIPRKNEKDYASYIGIEGKPELVSRAVELIKKYSTYIKGESPGKRSFI
tara:strand:- start:111 stop:467 length:357 start_codon:yes stop_codon:yes gene_type:complete